jgi:hypothetical protein
VSHVEKLEDDVRAAQAAGDKARAEHMERYDAEFGRIEDKPWEAAGIRRATWSRRRSKAEWAADRVAEEAERAEFKKLRRKANREANKAVRAMICARAEERAKFEAELNAPAVSIEKDGDCTVLRVSNSAWWTLKKRNNGFSKPTFGPPDGAA